MTPSIHDVHVYGYQYSFSPASLWLDVICIWWTCWCIISRYHFNFSVSVTYANFGGEKSHEESIRSGEICWWVWHTNRSSLYRKGHKICEKLLSNILMINITFYILFRVILFFCPHQLVKPHNIEGEPQGPVLISDYPVNHLSDFTGATAAVQSKFQNKWAIL